MWETCIASYTKMHILSQTVIQIIVSILEFQLYITTLKYYRLRLLLKNQNACNILQFQSTTEKGCLAKRREWHPTPLFNCSLAMDMEQCTYQISNSISITSHKAWIASPHNLWQSHFCWPFLSTTRSLNSFTYHCFVYHFFPFLFVLTDMRLV